MNFMFINYILTHICILIHLFNIYLEDKEYL